MPLALLTAMGCFSRAPSEAPPPAPTESPELEAPPDPEPVAPVPSAPVPVRRDGPLVVWGRSDGQATIAGRLEVAGWKPDHDIAVGELERLVAAGTPFSSPTGTGTLGAGPHWDCDRFLVPLPDSLDDLPVVVGVTAWNPFPRAVSEPELSDGVRARVRATVEAAGGRGELEVGSVLSADLDGDGEAEIAAAVVEQTLTNRYFEGEKPRVGDYSGMVVLPGDGSTGRWLGSVHTDPDASAWFEDYQALAAADLDGDGQLELFVKERGFSGGAKIELYRWSPEGLESAGHVAHWGETECSEQPWENWGPE